MDCTVKVEQGKLKGFISENDNEYKYYTFKGIPYAKPPVGELRFAVPQPPSPWESVKDATKECNICAQFDIITGTVVGDEDCLYLNVYTPSLNDSKILRPVMVYFHGGGFVFGNGTDTTQHGPAYLIEKDVVIVIPNYRVGILGFLSLDRKDAPGNMGLRDQVEALKWVQKNIANFGGDPNNVTIFGVSAGGASVEYLMISPMGKGLFHKAIAHSGSSLLHWAQNTKVKQLAAKVPQCEGITIENEDELLDYLKKLPTTKIITLSMTVILEMKFKGGIYFGFVPTIEKPKDWIPFLDNDTYELLTEGKFSIVPFMTGLCTREGLMMVSHGSHILKKLETEKRFLDHLPFEIVENERNDIESHLKKVYLENKPTGNETDAFAIDFFTDVDFLGGIYATAMLVAKHNPHVYFFEFAHDGALNVIKKNWNISREGAAHGDDSGYILKHHKLTDKLSDEDHFVQNTLIEMWTNFARNGDPNSTSTATKWEPFSVVHPRRLVIEKNLRMEDGVYPKRTKFYQKLYENKYVAQ